MANLNGFDAREVEPMEAFEPIPAGKYICAITASEVKPTKAGDGNFLEITLQVIEGEHKGRKLWDRLCLSHPNELAVKFARAKLAAICQATGILTPRDSTQLHDLPLEVKVGLKRREDNGEMANEVKAYAKKPAPGQAPQATNETPPWRRSQ